MARESVTINTGEDSLYKENAYLKNVTQIPSFSGNANVQLVSFPSLDSSKPQTSNPVIYAYECFQYNIVYELDEENIIHCNAYSHDGDIVKRNIIPAVSWDKTRPLANEFIGEYGMQTAEKFIKSSGEMRNLSFGQVQGLSEEVHGLPPGSWVDNADYDTMPVYNVSDGLSKVTVTRNITRKCACMCLCFCTSCFTSNNWLNITWSTEVAFVQISDQGVYNPNPSSGTPGVGQWYAGQNWNPTLSVPGPGLSNPENIKVAQSSWELSADGSIINIIWNYFCDSSLCSGYGYDAQSTYTYSFDVSWEVIGSHNTTEEPTGYWIVLKRNSDMFVLDAGDRYTLGQNLDKQWITQQLTIDGKTYMVEVLDTYADELAAGEQYKLAIDDYSNMALLGKDNLWHYFRTNDPDFPDLPLNSSLKTLDEYMTENPDISETKAKSNCKARVRFWNKFGSTDTIYGSFSPIFTDGYQKLFIPNNEDVLWFDVISSRIVVISKENVLWYSDAQTLKIDGLSYYETEYLNSKPLACWTLGNRIAIIADRMTQIWDLSSDVDDPLSPAFQGNTYSYRIIPDTVCRFQDAIFFLAAAVETPQLQLYSLDKSGAWARLSYPQLEHFINEKIPASPSEKYLFDYINAENMTASVSQFNNMDFIQWKLQDAILAYNTAFKTFFETDELTIYAGKIWYLWNASKTGLLTDYKNECVYKTKNTNFEGKLRAIRAIYIDHDVRGDLSQLYIVIDRVAGQRIENTRQLLFLPFTGTKNIRSRVNGLGSGTDISTKYKWVGKQEINTINYEVE